MTKQESLQLILSQVRPADGHFKTIEEGSNENERIQAMFSKLYPDESLDSDAFYTFSYKAKRYIYDNY